MALTIADPCTRREAFRAGFAGGGAAAALLLVPPAIVRAAQGDQAEVATLGRLVRLEQTAATVYGAAAEAPPLPKPLADSVALFHRQAEAHADLLARALEALGGTPPRAPSPADVEGLGGVRTRADFLAFAIALENRNVRAYVDALAELESPGTLGICTAAMAGAGQHLVVLREAAGASPAESVPAAFETGASPAPS